MYLCAHIVPLAVCLFAFLTSKLAITNGMEIVRQSNLQNDELEDKLMNNERSLPSILSIPLAKKACNGFPCMYSHLGTKAGRASLYKTLAGFIDDCFSDPACSPGRRKRQENSKTMKQSNFLPTLNALVRWRMLHEE